MHLLFALALCGPQKSGAPSLSAVERAVFGAYQPYVYFEAPVACRRHGSAALGCTTPLDIPRAECEALAADVAAALPPNATLPALRAAAPASCGVTVRCLADERRGAAARPPPPQ